MNCSIRSEFNSDLTPSHPSSLSIYFTAHICPFPKCTQNFSRFDNLRQHSKRHGPIAEWPQQARIAFLDAATASVPEEARHIDQITLGVIKAPTPPPAEETPVPEKGTESNKKNGKGKGKEDQVEEEEEEEGGIKKGKGKGKAKTGSAKGKGKGKVKNDDENGNTTEPKGKGKGKGKGKAKTTSSTSKANKKKVTNTSSEQENQEAAAELLEIASRAPTWSAQLDQHSIGNGNGNDLVQGDEDENIEPYFTESFFPSSPLPPTTAGGNQNQVGMTNGADGIQVGEGNGNGNGLEVNGTNGN